MAADPATPQQAASSLAIRRLGPADQTSMHALLDLFADVFAEPDTYLDARPPPDYLERLSQGESP